MSLFHSHDWATVSENYTPPRDGNIDAGELKMRGLGALDAYHAHLTAFERLVYGLTTVTQRCTACGQQRAYTVAGDGRPRP